jgi:HK97 family phage major capsid protein
MDSLDQIAALDAALDEIDAVPEASGPGHLETKSNWEAQNRAFDAFKAANDRRIAEIRQHGVPDPTTEAQVRNMEAELDRLTHAPENKAMRLGSRQAATPAAADDPRAVKRAVVEIGRELLRQGQVIDRMAGRGTRVKPAAQVATLQEKARQIERMVRAAEVKRNRPPFLASRYPGAGGHRRGQAAALLKAALVNWMRTGEESYRSFSIKNLQAVAYGRKDMHTELNPSGGYLVRPERRGGSPLEAALAELTPMRRLAEVRTLTEGDVFEIPINKKGTAAGWVSERAPRPPTATPEIALTRVPAMELYAEPVVSQRLLDHVDFPAEDWLVGEVTEAFSLQEGPAYITGTGTDQPEGMLSSDRQFVTDFTQWTHGVFRLVETGVDGAFPAPDLGPPPVVPGDVLIDVQSALKTAYQPRASWLMNRLTTGAVRKMVDTQGRYIWQPSVIPGQPPTLLGSPIDEDPNMPDIATDTISIGYGDWEATYLIVEKGGVRMTRDALTQKPFVLFYCTKYVGGGVKSFDAAIWLRFSA